MLNMSEVRKTTSGFKMAGPLPVHQMALVIHVSSTVEVWSGACTEIEEFLQVTNLNTDTSYTLLFRSLLCPTIATPRSKRKSDI